MDCYARGATNWLDLNGESGKLLTVADNCGLPRRGVEALTGTREVRHRVMGGNIQVGESAR